MLQEAQFRTPLLSDLESKIAECGLKGEDPMPIKPSEKEEEYFSRLEFERRKKLEEEKRAQMEVKESERLKQLHHMRCPKCGMQLIEMDYGGILVDKCSECYGVWLDAGELEAVSKLEKNKIDKWFGVFKK
jgi:hypothetical protein